jgi:hypothetical protein
VKWAAPFLRRIVKDEGVGAFYRGMGTKVTQTVFAAALMFAAKVGPVQVEFSLPIA